MKATVKRRTAGWLLLLADRADLGMSTAGLGERRDCYGVLDDSVKPYLITRYSTKVKFPGARSQLRL